MLRVYFPSMWDRVEHFQKKCTPGGAGLVLHIPIRNIDAIRHAAQSVALKLNALSAAYQLTSRQSVLIAFMVDASSDCPFLAMCSDSDPMYISVVHQDGTYCHTMQSALLAVAKMTRCDALGDAVILDPIEDSGVGLLSHCEGCEKNDTFDPPSYSPIPPTPVTFLQRTRKCWGGMWGMDRRFPMADVAPHEDAFGRID